jgi:UDP-glucuronate 4-epimerase
MTYRQQGFDIFNLGNSQPIALEYLVRLVEETLGKRARIKSMAMQPGDVPITFAKISRAKALLGYQPKVTIEEGIPLFVRWYRKSAKLARYSPV